MGKGSHKLFKNVVNDNLQDLTPLGESSSEVSHFIPEPRNFAEVVKLSDDIKKILAKGKSTGVQKSNKQSDFIVEDPKKVNLLLHE